MHIRVDMCTLVTKDSVRRLLEVRSESNLVRHGARGEKQRRLLAGQLGYVSLEGRC
jgi:hypothetical protein